MVLAEAGDLILHKRAVCGIDGRKSTPVVLEVLPLARALCQFLVHRALLGEQRTIGPRRPVEHRRRVRHAIIFPPFSSYN